MFVIDSRDTLSFAREHVARLKGAEASDLKHRVSWKQRSRVSWLRRHACRCNIETAPLAHHSA
jgi:hypothetical protein